MYQLRENQSTGEILENKMIERSQIENGCAGRNAERSATGDDQEEEEEYRTAARQKALGIVAESDWDE